MRCGLQSTRLDISSLPALGNMEPSAPAAKPVAAHGSRPPSPAAKALKGGVAQLKRLKGFFHTNLSALQMSFSPAAADDLDDLSHPVEGEGGQGGPWRTAREKEIWGGGEDEGGEDGEDEFPVEVKVGSWVDHVETFPDMSNGLLVSEVIRGYMATHPEEEIPHITGLHNATHGIDLDLSEYVCESIERGDVLVAVVQSYTEVDEEDEEEGKGNDADGASNARNTRNTKNTRNAKNTSSRTDGGDGGDGGEGGDGGGLPLATGVAQTSVCAGVGDGVGHDDFYSHHLNGDKDDTVYDDTEASSSGLPLHPSLYRDLNLNSILRAIDPDALDPDALDPDALDPDANLLDAAANTTEDDESTTTSAMSSPSPSAVSRPPTASPPGTNSRSGGGTGDAKAAGAVVGDVEGGGGATTTTAYTAAPVFCNCRSPTCPDLRLALGEGSPSGGPGGGPGGGGALLGLGEDDPFPGRGRDRERDGGQGQNMVEALRRRFRCVRRKIRNSQMRPGVEGGGRVRAGRTVC